MRYSEYANVIVKFGDSGMLSRPEIVGAALLDDVKVRRTKRNSYHFLSVEMARIDGSDPSSIAVFGTFVKNTELKREQILLNGELIEDEQSMQSSPSAFFCIFLAYHRMVYVPQTSFAPSLSEFSTTLRFFLRGAWSKDVKERYKWANSGEERVTWEDIYKAYPKPLVKVVHATSKDSIDEYISRFSKIEEVKITLIERNSEFDPSSSFQAMHEILGSADPNEAFVQAKNKVDGLNKPAISEIVEGATKGGYEEARLKGIGKNGEVLVGDNSEFKLKTPFSLTLAKGVAAAKASWKSFSNLLRSGELKVNFSQAELQENASVSQGLLRDYQKDG